MKRYLAIVTALVVAAGSLLAAATTQAQKADIVIGMQCDRTGATQIVGTVLCPGKHDYIALVNSKGGVEGHKIRAIEIDHEYKVPPGVESYERHKKEGAVSIDVYGTPHIYALAAKLTEDRIPGTSPGFGSAAAADGQRYPYIFPVAATYWSQAAAAVDFAKKQLGGSLKGKKIAYIFYDNPAGREPIQVIEDSIRSATATPKPHRRDEQRRWIILVSLLPVGALPTEGLPPPQGRPASPTR